MIVRRYVPEDRPLVTRLGRRLQIGVAGWRGREAVRAATSAWLEQSIQDEATTVLVAVPEGGDAVCGVVTLSTRTHFTGEVDAYVGELVVA